MKAVVIGIIVAVLAFGAWGAYTATQSFKQSIVAQAERTA
jgi:hypothetical protein